MDATMQAVLDRSGRKWQLVADVMCRAPAAFGIRLDTATQELAHLGAGFIYHIDGHIDRAYAGIDGDPAQAMDDVARLMQGVRPIPENFRGVDPDLLLLADAVNAAAVYDVRMPPERVSALAAKVVETAGYAQLKADCTDIGEYIELLRAEGRLTAEFSAMCVPEAIWEDRRYQGFVVWWQMMVITGNLVDHWKDLPEDNRTGLTGVPATADNRAKLRHSASQNIAGMSLYSPAATAIAAASIVPRYLVMSVMRGLGLDPAKPH
jgi:hypothetical protein